jgi:hypothetical protein
MKITYFGHIKNKYRENDEDVLQGFKDLGHEVIAFDDREFDVDKLIKSTMDADLFLFHKGGVLENASKDPVENSKIYQKTLDRLRSILERIPKTCVKAFWYVDKIYDGRHVFIESILPLVDFALLTDGTYVRRHKNVNLFSLKQGAVEGRVGKKKKIYECDIAYIGSVYGIRQDFVYKLNQEYGDRFRVYTNVRGDDFNDLCASAKIIISPHYPLDDFYWGDRIYRVLSSKGLMMHPKLYGLEEEEGLINGEHYIGYNNYYDLINKINMLLDPVNEDIREKVAKQGYEYAVKNLNYKAKCQKIIDLVKISK